MAIILGRYGDNTETGYTNFGTAPASGASNIRYVSTADGLDTNNGTTDVPGAPNGPFQTIMAAITWLNAQANAVGYWILLKMGEDFTAQLYGPLATYSVSGADVRVSGTAGSFDGTKWSNSTTWSGDPVLFSSYDPAYPVATYGPNPRQSSLTAPRITPYFANDIYLPLGSGGSATAFYGQNLYYSLRDPNNSTINMVYDGGASGNDGRTAINITASSQRNFFLIEDCEISFAGNGIGLSQAAQMQNLTIRRSRIYNQYNTLSNHSEGLILVAATNLTIEENMLDTNGYLPALSAPDAADVIFNHNIYVQADCTTASIRGNFIFRDPGGSKFQGAGITADDNCFSHATVDHNLSAPAGLPTILTNNVYLQSQTSPAPPPGTPVSGRGVGMGNTSNPPPDYANTGQITTTGNIMSNLISGGDYGFAISKGMNVTFNNNIIHKWGTVGQVLINERGGAGDLVFNVNGGGGLMVVSVFDVGTGTGAANHTYEPVSIASGGSGTGALLTITTDGSGVVNGVSVYIDPAGNTYVEAGKNYVVGDKLTLTAADIGGITGCIINADAVSLVSQSGNHIDTAGDGTAWNGGAPAQPFGTAGWNRTVLTYDTLTGGTGTLENFVSRIIATQRRQTWTSTLTAQVVDDYVREGFGITDAVSGGTGAAPGNQMRDGKVKSRRIKIPHVT